MKKSMKKLVSIILLAAILLVASGCGSSPENTATSEGTDEAAAEGTTEEESTEAAETTEEAAGQTEYAVDPKTTKLAIICQTIGTEPFLLQVVDAVKEYADKYGFTYSFIECASPDDFLNNGRAVVQEGYTMILGVGWMAVDAITDIATNYPDAATYAIIDSTVELDNVTSINYDMSEASYVMGVLMASCFPEEKVFGIVGAMQTQKTYEQRYGVMQGILSVTPEAEFIQNFTQSYSEPQKAREYAQQQMSQGATVIIGMAAAAGDQGIFNLALERPGEIFTSGQEVDMTTAENDYILTGQIKDTGVTTKYVLDNYFAGTLKSGTDILKLEGGCTGAVHVTHPGAYRSSYVTDEAIAAAKEAAEKILSGEIVIETPIE